MAQLSQVLTQRIWGAYNPVTGALVGVQTSGEAPYQAVANTAIVTNYPGVRTTSHVNTSMVTTLGKVTQGDGGGTTFVYNPTDTTTGAVAIGSSSGTVLNLTSVQGTVAVGLTVCSSITGAPMGVTILSFGTGAGGPGTYNLSGPLSQAGPFTFLIDNNTTILVSGDGSRWYLNSTSTVITSFLAPSGNSAINITTPTYTFGNATDNPNFVYAGTGTTTFASGALTASGLANFGEINLTGAATPTNGINLPGVNVLGIYTASTERIQISQTGVVNILAPSTGNALAVAGVSGFPPVLSTAGGATDVAFRAVGLAGGMGAIELTGNSSSNSFIGVAGATNQLWTGSAVGDLVLQNTTSGAMRFVLNNTTQVLAMTSAGATFFGETAISGTATNDNAAGGYVGEIVTSAGSSTSLTTATAAALTGASISLTAGDWDVSVVVGFQPAATTSVTLYAYGSSTTSAALPAVPQSIQSAFASVVTGAATTNFSVPPFRYSLASTTTIFCNAQANFSVSTMTAIGFLRARRVR